jgi:hypothetical protein
MVYCIGVVLSVSHAGVAFAVCSIAPFSFVHVVAIYPWALVKILLVVSGMRSLLQAR